MLTQAQVELVVSRTKAYLALESTVACYCDWITGRNHPEVQTGDLDTEEAEQMLWAVDPHIPLAFEGAPDYTGCKMYALDHALYVDTYFQADQLAGEYGKARKRLVQHALKYWESLQD